MDKFMNHKKYPYILLLVSLIFISPQIITQNMIIGSDAIFHFNRFFDTSEQLKNGNFEYFISIYGFQQSGRIVNALYGPFLAYFHGLLVLISKNWFVYQVLSNFILYNLAGFSMYKFLASGNISPKKSLMGSVLYMCSFSILYWSTRQGFSSWGAALMPLCLSLIFDVLEERKVPKFRLGISVALLFQIHNLSAVMLVLIFMPIFLFAFCKSNQKFTFLRDMISEIGLFVLLTMNIWYALIRVTGGNQLITPFINQTMSLNTVNMNSYYWLINPGSLLLILLFVILFLIKRWKMNDIGTKIIFVTMLFFLLLSTSIVPWDFLIQRHFFIAELIQFPFRFFTPVTIFSIYFFLKVKNFKRVTEVFVYLGILQVVILMFVTLSTWNKSEDFILSGSKTVFREQDIEKIKKSFYSKNKNEALELVTKSTPDYLPLYADNGSADFYGLYKNKIIDNNLNFKKSIMGRKLIVQNIRLVGEVIEFPVIIYADTSITTMGNQLTKEQYSLSTIGTPIINAKYIQNNQIEIAFKHKFSDIFIYLTILLWCLLIVFYLYCKTKNINIFL